MKTVGLIGGMSHESTALYYRLINQAVRARLGGLHSAKAVVYSVDFAEVAALQRTGRWDDAGELLASVAQALERAGSDFLLICANTMHKVEPRILQAVSIPVLHVCDATGDAIRRAGYRRVGLLGTSFTMEQDFYRDRLAEKSGLEVLIPEAEDRQILHKVIFEELCLGKVTEASRQQYLRIIRSLQDRGGEAVILGCTELALLELEKDSPIPTFDTTAIHAQAAVERALA